MSFKPKYVKCLIKTDRYKYTCKNIHLDEQGHESNTVYRFNTKMPYLVKNQEDYDELISLDMFEAHDSGEKEVKKKSKKKEKVEEVENPVQEPEEIIETIEDSVPEAD